MESKFQISLASAYRGVRTCWVYSAPSRRIYSRSLVRRGFPAKNPEWAWTGDLRVSSVGHRRNGPVWGDECVDHRPRLAVAISSDGDSPPRWGRNHRLIPSLAKAMQRVERLVGFPAIPGHDQNFPNPHCGTCPIALESSGGAKSVRAFGTAVATLPLRVCGLLLE